MPMYRNFRTREVTIFLDNAVPIKFFPGEHKELRQEGLEKKYASYIQRVDIVKEEKEKKVAKTEKGLINEVKQPDPNKELTKEPVLEKTKKGKIITEDPRISEGYSPFQGEQTIAGVGRGRKE